MNNSLYNTGYAPNQNIMPNMNNYQHSYVEEYLKMHLGKRVEAHVSFCDSIDWRDSIFTGTLEDVGKDYIVISNDNKSYVIWSIYIDYIVLIKNYQ